MSLTAGQRKTFAVTWITYAGFYLCRKNLSIVLPMLAGVAGLHSIQLANIVFGYSLLYAIGQFGFGFLSDRIGPKRVVGAGLLLIVGSNIMMGLHASLVWLLLFACLNGVGQSTGWSGLVKTMANWFSYEHRGIVMAWWGTNYVLGGFLATAFATWAVAEHSLWTQLGWARGFLFPASLLLVIALLFLIYIKDTPAQIFPRASPSVGQTASVPDRTSWADLKGLLCKPSLWTIGISYFFLELCRYGLMFWLPYYMVQQLHYGLAPAGYLSSLYELIGIVGALLAGYISDRFNQSRRAPVSAVMLCGLGLVMLFQPALARSGLVGIGLAISLAGLLSYGPDTLLSGAAAQDVGETRLAATASGLIDGIGHLGALFSPYVVISISERYGWDRLFVVFAATAFVAGLVLLPLWNLNGSGETMDSFHESAVQEPV
jgi:OPA family sugar phosphate sensor protein UhpC-like MFS transporter